MRDAEALQEVNISALTNLDAFLGEARAFVAQANRILDRQRRVKWLMIKPGLAAPI